MGRSSDANPTPFEGRNRTSATTVLLSEDDRTANLIMREVLEAEGYGVIEATSLIEARQRLDEIRPHAAILDIHLPDGDSLGLLSHLREVDPMIALVVLTADDSVELAVEAMRRGADHFLTKPAAPGELLEVLALCLEERRAHRRQGGYDVNRSRRRPDPFRGTSPAIGKLEQLARKVAVTDRPVLLGGETGCGKGVLAHWLHGNSSRSEEAFVDLNCAGLKPELMESELFGYAKGAFTGASAAKPGLLEVADRGTLFLDEIGDMDLGIQARLLKVLEEQSFRRLGHVRERRVDVRLIAASNRDLALLVRKGTFRQDLYFRLNTLRLEIPPLRHRLEDIPALAELLLEQLGRELNRPSLALSQGALEALVRYRWPGNIRELRNLLEHAVLFGDTDVLGEHDFRFEAPESAAASDVLDLSLEELEQLHIARVLEHENGSVARTARRLGIQRNTLYQKIKKYHLERPGA